MNSPSPSKSRRPHFLASAKSIFTGHKIGSSLAVGSLLLLTVAAVVANAVDAQPKPSANIDQCENLGTVCDSSNPGNWINGNLGQNNSTYPETSSVPFRAVMNNLSVDSTYMVTLEWDTTVNGGDHAFDYLTSFDRTVGTADPCAGITCTSPTNTLAIPVDPNVTGAGVTQLGGQVFTLKGGTFPADGASITNVGNLCGTGTCSIATNPSAYTLNDPYTQNSSTRIKLYFTAKSSTVVLAWGGHVASQNDWGVGNSAIDIPGSPYHMMLLTFLCSDNPNCGTGRQDLSMSSSAVVPVTTTTVPETTTTVEETTTTVEETTTTVEETTTTVEETTTTVPETTTTVPETTTTVPETTTTVADTVPEEITTTTVTSDTSPEEFPTTGSNSRGLWVAAMTLVVLGGIAATSIALRNKKWR